MSRSVLCIARNEDQARNITESLKLDGFHRNDISVLFADKSGARDSAHEEHTKAPEGATAGANAGGLLGGAVGWLAGIGSIAIPGVGPFIAAGPIMAALGGVAIGVASGGLVGALVGMGIPEYEAKQFEDRLRLGNILISVHAENSDDLTRIQRIYELEGAELVSSTDESPVTGTPTPVRPAAYRPDRRPRP
jgi:hypothetical protein